MNVTLDQWKALISVVDSGGYEKAAEALQKSQSSVTYAVQKLQSQLGVKAFEVKGRKAVLTPTGEFLYRRARALLEEAEATERAAKKLSAGWEAEIGIRRKASSRHAPSLPPPQAARVLVDRGTRRSA